MPFDTPLSTDEEQQFQVWKKVNAPNDSGADYDLRGAYKSGLKSDPQTQHWADTYKKPNHPTFSDESIYSSLAGTRPGHWEGNKFVPFQDQPMFNKLPDMIRMKGLESQIKAGLTTIGSGASSNDVFDQITSRTLQTGAFADAYKRLSIHHERANEVYGEGGNPMKPFMDPPMLTAQMSNRSAQDQMDNTMSRSIPGISKPAEIRSKIGDMPSGHAMTPEQLRLKNLELDRIEQRLTGKKKVLPYQEESETDIAKRLGM